MANTLMSLLVKLGLDSAELDSGLAKTESSVSNRMKNIGGSMMKTGGIMTAGLTLPIIAAGVKMVDSASDMAESTSKVGVVFGENAGEIQSWAKTAATSLGMSSQQALEAAGTYGNLFQALGLGVQDATDMSKSVVGLAADLASFNNASPEETLLALRSGLSGEMEPLKKYGVAMNETAMESMASSMGLGDNIQALSEAEKMQVRYGVIMSQTSLAQGDFIRTSDGMANTTKILKARLVDVAAELGEKLLPLGLKLAILASDLVGKFSSLTSGQQNMILIVVGVVAAIGPLTTIIGALSTALGAVIPLFTGLITAMKVYSMQTSVVPLTNALTVAFGAQAVAIGAAAAALVALIAVGYTYYKQIIVRQKEGIEANTEAWKNLYSAMEGADTAAIMAKYTRTIGNMNKAYKDSNAIARLFVNLQGLEFTGFRDLERVLVTTTSNYEDYVKQLRTAAALQGLTITDTGQLIRMVDNFDGTLEEVTVGVLQYTEGLYDATRSAEGMTAMTNEGTRALARMATGLPDVDKGLKDLETDFGGLYKVVDTMQGLYNNFNEKQDELIQKQKDAQAAIDEAIRQGYNPAGSKLKELYGNLEDINTQLDATGTAFERESKRAILAMLEQKLSAGGLSNTEFTILTKLGVQWGIYSQAVVNEAAIINTAINEGIDLTNLDKFKGYMEYMLAHPGINISFDYWLTVHGTEPSAPNVPSVPGGTHIPLASGGLFSGWAMVGDAPGGGITPYTEWVYGSGTVYNQAQMAGRSVPPMAAGGAIPPAKLGEQKTDITVQVYANVADNIDLEAMAYRVAGVISRRVS